MHDFDIVALIKSASHAHLSAHDLLRRLDHAGEGVGLRLLVSLHQRMAAEFHILPHGVAECFTRDGAAVSAVTADIKAGINDHDLFTVDNSAILVGCYKDESPHRQAQFRYIPAHHIDNPLFAPLPATRCPVNGDVPAD